MSVDQLPPGRARPANRDAQFVRCDEYIDKQIQATRRLVKSVDLTTALLVMTIGTLVFLLAAAVIEHWLVPGGFNLGVRLVLFVALVGGLSVYVTRRLWPLCVRAINPAYAAQTIEHENPSLKNSLLNLLLFRENREVITDAVYETLEEQAAQRLTRVPVESAVDRTHLLRLAYVLLAVVALAALYKIVSPKDPLVTAGRVLMPWARIAPASRVTIDNIEPGTVTLARGEVLSVSADVHGIGEDDPVVLRYTTSDGQAVDRPAPMAPSTAGLRFTGQIPPQQDAAQGGIAQDLHYRIEAGDARSLEFTVTVVAAPTITVERIDYDYPDYTRFVDRSIDRLGDIRAIEGTRVTIHARANEPIESASVDFEADGRRDLALAAEGSDAQASFLLELRDNRHTPKFTSYVLRFTGVDGRSNRDPVKFPIDVVPDLAPEAAILAPAEKSRDVRLDETVAIEVEARDPDFALAAVRLQGEAAGRTLFDEKLLATEHTRRFTGRLLFTPGEHGLHAGDVVRYWVTAGDNRAPQANETTSDSQTLRIVGPQPRQPGQPPQDRVAQRDQRQPQDGSESKDGQQQPGNEGQAGGESSNSSQGNEQQSGESASADGQSGNKSNQDSPGQSSKESGEQSGESPSEGSQSGESQIGESSQGSSQSGEQSKARPGEQSGKPQQGSDSRSQGGEPNGESDAAQRQPGNEDGKAGANQDAERQPGEQNQQQPGRESAPVSSDGDNDGEAFERIQDFLKREGQLPKEGQSPNDDSQSRSGESASTDGKKPEESQQLGDDKTQRHDNGEQPSEDGKRQEAPDEKPGINSNSDTKDPDRSTQPKAGQSQDKSSESAERNQQPTGGQETSSQGESGAGKQPEQSQGAPEAQPDMKPGDKWQQKPSGDKPRDQQEAPSGGHGKRESDSQGDQGGDHTGGGEEGSGQKSPHEGTGSEGQNQSADQGAGESSEQGAGHDSQSAGKDAPSQDRTGESGSKEQGPGSSQREGQGAQPGGSQKQDGESASADGDQPKDSTNQSGQHSQQSQDKAPQDASHQEPSSSDRQDGGGTTPDGAGRVPNGTMQPSPSTGEAPGADAANLDYARKQTDLVVETLAEQMKRQKVDRRLLDKLGWTEAELRRFVERWQQLKAAADGKGPDAVDAQRELDEALRSLGLRRGKLEQAKVTDDQLRNLRQGYRGAVPLEYQERLRAYNQGVSRARQDGE